MRLAVVHKDDEIYTEIKPDDFVEFLSKELDIDKSRVQSVMDRLIVELKRQTLYK